MTEFNDRMVLQRRIIQIVNNKFSRNEELFSLSSKAIERWLLANSFDKDSNIAGLLNAVSSKLFFLAAKSQEQISEDYKLLSANISQILLEIENLALKQNQKI